MKAVRAVHDDRLLLGKLAHPLGHALGVPPHDALGDVLLPRHEMLWPRVDELFADVQQRLEQRTERIDVRYDPTFGYPRSIVVDIALMAADDEYSLTAGNLRRLP